MATTATLNGGATGGLHATPTLIHADNPPQEEICRVDSNSSFESGHEELIQMQRGEEGAKGGAEPEAANNNNAWELADPATPTNNKGGEGSNAYYMDFSEASSKKRRKQSRPVRIPTEGAEEGVAPTPIEEGEKRHRQHYVPLNLSGRNENSCSGDETTTTQQKPSSSFSASNRNSFSENDKTELLAGQGTKDSPHRSPSSSLPLSFSPGLFPLGAPNSFSSIFSANLNLFSQAQQNPGPAGTPTSSSSAGSNSGLLAGTVSALQNLPPHRIFNPEAYCDLCNKEFCNKYFLKTHKANKHGVYTEMSPSLGMGQIIAANSPSNTSFLTGAAILSSAALANSNSGGGGASCQQQQSLPQSSSQQQQTGNVSGTSPSPMGKGTGGLSSEIPFSLASFSLEKGAGNSNGSQQRESFCELCQKVFCNKYFLRRHKAKIHGIPLDSYSTGSGRSSSSSNHGKSEGQRSFSNGAGGDKGFNLRDMGLETLGLEIVAKHLEETAGGKEEGELSADEERESGKSPENVGEDENSSPYRMSSLDFKLPVTNPNASGENSCQFCLREFPSKQLLINHLVKKHRLLIPSTFPPFLFPFPALFEGHGDGEGEHMPLLDNNGNATSGGGGQGDYECNLCNRFFQTVYLLRMHKSYFHPDSVQGEEAEERDSTYKQQSTKREMEDGEEENDQDQETGFNSEHESNGSGKASPPLDDNNANQTSRRERSKAKESNKKPTLSLAEIEGRGEDVSDSDELRRLQTMIMELNRVSSAAVAWSPPLDGGLGAHLSLPPPLTMGQSSGSSTFCRTCNKEFYSSYFLQQHIQHFHTNNAPNNAGESFGGVKCESPLNSLAGRSGTDSPHGGSIRIKAESFLPSEISVGGVGGGGGSKKSLGGDLSHSGINISPETLKERLLHPDSFSSDNSSTFLTPGPKGNNNNNINNNNSINSINSINAINAINKDGLKRPSPSLSRSYCTICHKELCNKYFMRTHMLKMHGISIESSTGLGGVTCDICNKELCSKYFLKVHKQNTHGIVEEGPSPSNSTTPGPLPNMSQSSSANLSLLSNSSLTGLNLSTNSSATSPLSDGNPSTYSTSDPNSIPLLPKEAGDLQSRYFCHYSEVCPFCGRRFRSPKWLKSHLQQDHGEEGRERWKNIERSLRRGQKSSSSSSRMSSASFPLGPAATPSSKGTLTSGSSSKSGRERDGNKCAFCTFSTGDVETMKSHLIKEHSNQLANRQTLSEVASMSTGLQEAQSGMLLDPLTMLFQKMEGGSGKLYRCSYCPFTTSILVYLYAHERTHTGLGASSSVNSQLGSGEGPSFQCPMCFHSFDQPEAFQQHLIGHQMSGVLAPFFTPASNSGNRLGLQSSPTESGDPSSDTRSLLSLPWQGMNGNAGDNLYWALKNQSAAAHGLTNGDRLDQDNKSEEEEEEPAADLTTAARKKRSHEEDMCVDPRPRKREKVLRFRCSYCQSRFASRELALAHVHQIHGGGGGGGGGDGGSRRQGGNEAKRFRKNFRCRKCKFTSATYQMLVVHNKLQHSAFRPTSHGPATTSTGTGPCEEQELPEGRGVAQEEGQFLMQGFLLTSSEEENSNQFVPSVVYLPVREKVSQSIRVSFSLTPTSESDNSPQQPPQE